MKKHNNLNSASSFSKNGLNSSYQKNATMNSNESTSSMHSNSAKFRVRKLISKHQPDYCGECEPVKFNLGDSDKNDLPRATPMSTSYTYPTFSQAHSLPNDLPKFNRIASLNDLDNNNFHRSETLPKVNSKVRLYKKLPLRSMSRAWGELNSINLPVWCRKPCYYFYSWMFNCNLNEMDIQDLTHYKNLSEFFRRALRPDARIIHPDSCLTSPCDGKILHFGKVENGYLEQVKGVNYSLKAFLGEQTWPKNNSINPLDNINLDDPNNNTFVDGLKNEDMLYEKKILYNPKNCLYHCVIYLAPGDYHRFHSPTEWEIFYRRHFPGELFSVNPSVARWLQGLFNMNERVVYYGQWKYGFFSMTPVGATNVGSIRVYMDEELTTNNKIKKNENSRENQEKSFCSTKFTTGENQEQLSGVKISRGDNFGEFNLGSTIVLIFEAPESFEFDVNQNEKIFLGNKLGSSIQSTKL